MDWDLNLYSELVDEGVSFRQMENELEQLRAEIKQLKSNHFELSLKHSKFRTHAGVLRANFHSLWLTARREHCESKEIIDSLKNELTQPAFIQCPNCDQTFNSTARKPPKPKNVRPLTSKNTVEIDFRCREDMEKWVTCQGYGINVGDNLPSFPDSLNAWLARRLQPSLRSMSDVVSDRRNQLLLSGTDAGLSQMSTSCDMHDVAGGNFATPIPSITAGDVSLPSVGEDEFGFMIDAAETGDGRLSSNEKATSSCPDGMRLARDKMDKISHSEKQKNGSSSRGFKTPGVNSSCSRNTCSGKKNSTKSANRKCPVSVRENNREVISVSSRKILPKPPPAKNFELRNGVIVRMNNEEKGVHGGCGGFTVDRTVPKSKLIPDSSRNQPTCSNERVADKTIVDNGLSRNYIESSIPTGFSDLSFNTSALPLNVSTSSVGISVSGGGSDDGLMGDDRSTADVSESGDPVAGSDGDGRKLVTPTPALSAPKFDYRRLSLGSLLPPRVSSPPVYILQTPLSPESTVKSIQAASASLNSSLKLQPARKRNGSSSSSSEKTLMIDEGTISRVTSLPGDCFEKGSEYFVSESEVSGVSANITSCTSLQSSNSKSCVLERHNQKVKENYSFTNNTVSSDSDGIKHCSAGREPLISPLDCSIGHQPAGKSVPPQLTKSSLVEGNNSRQCSVVLKDVLGSNPVGIVANPDFVPSVSSSLCSPKIGSESANICNSVFPTGPNGPILVSAAAGLDSDSGKSLSDICNSVPINICVINASTSGLENEVVTSESDTETTDRTDSSGHPKLVKKKNLLKVKLVKKNSKGSAQMNKKKRKIDAGESHGAPKKPKKLRQTKLDIELFGEDSLSIDTLDHAAFAQPRNNFSTGEPNLSHAADSDHLIPESGGPTLMNENRNPPTSNTSDQAPKIFETTESTYKHKFQRNSPVAAQLAILDSAMQSSCPQLQHRANVQMQLMLSSNANGNSKSNSSHRSITPKSSCRRRCLDNSDGDSEIDRLQDCHVDRNNCAENANANFVDKNPSSSGRFNYYDSVASPFELTTLADCNFCDLLSSVSIGNLKGFKKSLRPVDAAAKSTTDKASLKKKAKLPATVDAGDCNRKSEIVGSNQSSSIAVNEDVSSATVSATTNSDLLDKISAMMRKINTTESIFDACRKAVGGFPGGSVVDKGAAPKANSENLQTAKVTFKVPAVPKKEKVAVAGFVDAPKVQPVKKLQPLQSATVSSDAKGVEMKVSSSDGPGFLNSFSPAPLADNNYVPSTSTEDRQRDQSISSNDQIKTNENSCSISRTNILIKSKLKREDGEEVEEGEISDDSCAPPSPAPPKISENNSTAPSSSETIPKPPVEPKFVPKPPADPKFISKPPADPKLPLKMPRLSYDELFAESERKKRAKLLLERASAASNGDVDEVGPEVRYTPFQLVKPAQPKLDHPVTEFRRSDTIQFKSPLDACYARDQVKKANSREDRYGSRLSPGLLEVENERRKRLRERILESRRDRISQERQTGGGSRPSTFADRYRQNYHQRRSQTRSPPGHLRKYARKSLERKISSSHYRRRSPIPNSDARRRLSRDRTVVSKDRRVEAHDRKRDKSHDLDDKHRHKSKRASPETANRKRVDQKSRAHHHSSHHRSRDRESEKVKSEGKEKRSKIIESTSDKIRSKRSKFSRNRSIPSDSSDSDGECSQIKGSNDKNNRTKSAEAVHSAHLSSSLMPTKDQLHIDNPNSSYPSDIFDAGDCLDELPEHDAGPVIPKDGIAASPSASGDEAVQQPSRKRYNFRDRKKILVVEGDLSDSHLDSEKTDELKTDMFSSVPDNLFQISTICQDDLATDFIHPEETRLAAKQSSALETPSFMNADESTNCSVGKFDIVPTSDAVTSSNKLKIMLRKAQRAAIQKTDTAVKKPDLPSTVCCTLTESAKGVSVFSRNSTDSAQLTDFSQVRDESNLQSSFNSHADKPVASSGIAEACVPSKSGKSAKKSPEVDDSHKSNESPGNFDDLEFEKCSRESDIDPPGCRPLASHLPPGGGSTWLGDEPNLQLLDDGLDTDLEDHPHHSMVAPPQSRVSSHSKRSSNRTKSVRKMPSPITSTQSIELSPLIDAVGIYNNLETYQKEGGTASSNKRPRSLETVSPLGMNLLDCDKFRSYVNHGIPSWQDQQQPVEVNNCRVVLSPVQDGLFVKTPEEGGDVGQLSDGETSMRSSFCSVHSGPPQCVSLSVSPSGVVKQSNPEKDEINKNGYLMVNDAVALVKPNGHQNDQPSSCLQDDLALSSSDSESEPDGKQRGDLIESADLSQIRSIQDNELAMYMLRNDLQISNSASNSRAHNILPGGSLLSPDFRANICRESGDFTASTSTPKNSSFDRNAPVDFSEKVFNSTNQRKEASSGGKNHADVVNSKRKDLKLAGLEATSTKVSNDIGDKNLSNPVFIPISQEIDIEIPLCFDSDDDDDQEEGFAIDLGVVGQSGSTSPTSMGSSNDRDDDGDDDDDDDSFGQDVGNQDHNRPHKFTANCGSKNGLKNDDNPQIPSCSDSNTKPVEGLGQPPVCRGKNIRMCDFTPEKEQTTRNSPAKINPGASDPTPSIQTADLSQSKDSSKSDRLSVWKCSFEKHSLSTSLLK